ncbi:MAG: hypothetical protein HC836_19255 [Richelia sp. RM2_1_2]|nr:hypothetical protein [Richelia sp. RM2_1_2]
MIPVVNKSDLIPFLSDFLDIDVEGHILIEIDSMVYESPLELSDSDFFLIKRILGLPPGNHTMVEDLDQIKKMSIKVFNILVLGIENGIVCNELYSMQKGDDKDKSISLKSKDNLLGFSWYSSGSEEQNNFIKNFLEEDYYFQSINLRNETDKYNGEVLIDAVWFNEYLFIFEISNLPGHINLKVYIKLINQELALAFINNNQIQFNHYEDKEFKIGVIAWAMLALRNIARKQYNNYNFCGNKEGILEIVEKERGHLYTCGIFEKDVLVSYLNLDDYENLESLISDNILEQANLKR